MTLLDATGGAAAGTLPTPSPRRGRRSSVLRSDRAVQVNIEIMRAWVRLREILSSHHTGAAVRDRATLFLTDRSRCLCLSS